MGVELKQLSFQKKSPRLTLAQLTQSRILVAPKLSKKRGKVKYALAVNTAAGRKNLARLNKKTNPAIRFSAIFFSSRQRSVHPRRLAPLGRPPPPTGLLRAWGDPLPEGPGEEGLGRVRLQGDGREGEGRLRGGGSYNLKCFLLTAVFIGGKYSSLWNLRRRCVSFLLVFCVGS